MYFNQTLNLDNQEQIDEDEENEDEDTRTTRGKKISLSNKP